MQIKSNTKTPEKLSLELRTHFTKNKLKQVDIERNTGVNQAQISRILNGKFRNVDSKNVKLLCKYANLITKNESQLTKKANQSVLLMDAINSVWDGSECQEKLLAKLIKSMKPTLKIISIKGFGNK